MPQIPFSDRKIASLKIPSQGQDDYFDANTPGLGIRVSYGGSKAWFLKYLYKGKQRRIKLGRYPAVKLVDARKVALEIRHRVALENRDPAAEKKRSANANTFKEVAQLFVADYCKGPDYVAWEQGKRDDEPRPNKRSWKADERMLIKGPYFKPLHDMLASEISDQEIETQLKLVARNNGGVMANRCLFAVRKMFNWAKRQTSISVSYNPAIELEKPVKEVTRDRVYIDDEIRKLWAQLGQMGTSGRVLKMCLITGQRSQECAGMEWGEVEGNIWTLPGARTKNGMTHIVPLSNLALDVIESSANVDSDYVFPSRTKENAHTSYLGRARRRVQQDSGVSDFRIHDLRRTCATNITKRGFTRFIADRVLNHVEKGVGGTYDRYDYLKEKTEALDAWATHLQAILAENVVPIGTAKKKA